MEIKWLEYLISEEKSFEKTSLNQKEYILLIISNII